MKVLSTFFATVILAVTVAGCVTAPAPLSSFTYPDVKTWGKNETVTPMTDGCKNWVKWMDTSGFKFETSPDGKENTWMLIKWMNQPATKSLTSPGNPPSAEIKERFDSAAKIFLATGDAAKQRDGYENTLKVISQLSPSMTFKQASKLMFVFATPVQDYVKSLSTLERESNQALWKTMAFMARAGIDNESDMFMTVLLAMEFYNENEKISMTHFDSVRQFPFDAKFKSFVYSLYTGNAKEVEAIMRTVDVGWAHSRTMIQICKPK